MKIVVIGTGFVGLPHAAVLSEYGHEVYAYDIDELRIAAYESGERARIERYVNEPGLVEAFKETHGRYLFFTTDLAAVIEGAELVFSACPRPLNAMALPTSTPIGVPPITWPSCFRSGRIRRVLPW